MEDVTICFHEIVNTYRYLLNNRLSRILVPDISRNYVPFGNKEKSEQFKIHNPYDKCHNNDQDLATPVNKLRITS